MVGASDDTNPEEVTAPGAVWEALTREEDETLDEAARLLASGRALDAMTVLEAKTPDPEWVPRWAALLVSAALEAREAPHAVALLQERLGEYRGAVQDAARRQLARLLRRMQEPEPAIEVLHACLREAPKDRRARGVLQGLLQRLARWDELDAVLEHEVHQAETEGRWRRASRASLRRARLEGEQLTRPARAALRYSQAAGFLEQAEDAEAAFGLRLLWLRALAAAESSKEALSEAVKACEALAVRVGREAQARQVIDELRLGLPEVPQQGTPAILSAAEDAVAQGRLPEAMALFQAAARDTRDRLAHQKLEAHCISRGAWRELAELYRTRAEQSADPAERALLLTQLAGVLENELRDLTHAGTVWAEIATLTGDPSALQEQLRLLSEREDISGLRRALDEAVLRAADAARRAEALVARADAGLGRGALNEARVDYQAAQALVPHHLRALAGLAQSASFEERPGSIRALREALASVERRSPGRLEALRRLASLAELPPVDGELLLWVWTEVLEEAPDDSAARGRLTSLAREQGDLSHLERLLRAELQLQPRGPAARKAWLELVSLLESASEDEAALAELRQAVRFEPGHKEAWLLLVERFTGRGQVGEAAWALEEAAVATEDAAERWPLWARLGRFCRDLLGDDARAEVYEKRARVLRESLGDVPAGEEEERTLEEEAAVVEDPPFEPLSNTDTQPLDLEPGWIPETLLVPRLPLRVALPVIEAQLQRQVQESPLDAQLYRDMAQSFDAHAQSARAALMREIADALESRVSSLPRRPRLLLSSRDRAELRHPGLRQAAGDLLVTVGGALCRLYVRNGQELESGDLFRESSGPGGPAAAEALLAAVHILGLQSPVVLVSSHEGPPFSLVYGTAPRLTVGRQAVHRQIPEAELRFFAGRSLFSLNPDLLALRCLSREILEQGLSRVASIVRKQNEGRADEQLLEEILTEAGVARAAILLKAAMRKLSLSSMAAAARHSANRAGLVVCGGVGPALAALRGKQARDREIAELVRFAASEPYLHLRMRKLA